MPAMDALFENVKLKGHVCIGLDTAASYLPENPLKNISNEAQAVLAYNKLIVDETIDIAACYKVQIAYYEEMGIEGLKTYSETLKYIRGKGGLVIADIKRGDIADTAKRYAKAHYSGDFESDFVTLNPYMGMDSIEPWLDEARLCGKGAFVLMMTSNTGMRDFEYQKLENGRRLYSEVGDRLSLLASRYKAACGYGLFGAVVGCTETGEAALIRGNYGNLFFLIPGYGAQGGAAKDAAVLLREGNGGVVNASRSIITAWCNEIHSEKQEVDLAFCAECARKAALKMRDEIKAALL
jgi:orotidine-5'-phosphate decarboxylase